MASNKNGIITRKDIIEDAALEFGKLYADQLKVAIEQNKVFVKGIKDIRDGMNDILKASNNSEYIKAKNAEALATQKASDALKLQIQSEIGLQKVRKEKETADKAAISTENAKQAQQKKSIQLSAQERFDAQQKNKNDKDQIIITSRLTSELQKLDAKVRLAKRAYLDIFIAGQQVGESTKTYTRRLNEARDAYDKLKDKSIAANRAVRQFNDNVGNYPKQAITGLRNLVGAFGLVGGVAAFASIVKKNIEIIKEFDQSVADLSAITGASGADLDFLKEKAIELGRGTKGGAIAVVEAYKLIASAKPELLTNVKALNEVTAATILLSQASGLEIPDAATRFSDALNQFGADASKAGVFVDALANGAKFGAAEIPEITDALLKFGAVARTSNISIQESTALIELLAENGLKGADAGTALRNVLLKISAPDALGKRARAELDKLGISLDTLKDKSIPLQQKLELLQPLLKDNASIVKIFGLENATAAINVLSHTDRLADLTSKMGTVGTAAEQAAIRTDTLQGATDRLDSAYQSYILKISEASSANSLLTKAVSFLGDNLEQVLNTILKLGSVFLAYFVTMKSVAFITNAYRAIQVASTAAQIAFTTATGIGTTAMKAQALAAEEAAIAQGELNVAVSATPWGLILGLIAAAVAGYIAFSDSLSKAEQSMIRLNNESERFKKQEESTNKESDEFRNQLFKKIEDEISLRRKKGEDSKKLDKEEIDRKGVILLNELQTYTQTKDFQEKATKNQIAESEKRIAQMKKEQKAGSTNGRRIDQLEVSIGNETENLKSLKTFLENNSKITIQEKQKLNDLLSGLNKQAVLDNAENEVELTKKQIAAAKKAAKEKYEDQKKADEALFKLQQLRVQQAIDINDFIIEDEKATLQEKLDANSENAQLLSELKRNQAEFDLRELGKYNDKTGKFVRQLTDSEISDIINTGKTKRELRADELVIYETFKNSQLEIDKKFGLKSIKLIEEDAKKKFDAAFAAFNDVQKEQENIGNIEIENLNKKLRKKQITQENYDEQRKELEIKIAKESLESQSAYLEEQVVALATTEEEKQAIRDKFAEIRAKKDDIEQTKFLDKLKKQRELITESSNLIANALGLNADNLATFFNKTIENIQVLAEGGKLKFSDFAESAVAALNVISEVSQKLSEQKLASIDQEIEAANKYYENEILKAGDDQRKKDLIQKQQKTVTDALEKKKRQEAYKQAVLSKNISLVQTTILGAQAAIKGFADSGYAGLIIALAATAASIAIIESTSIPKPYKKGRKGGIAEDAIVAEGKSGGKWVPEVVTDKRGQNPVLYTEPSLIRLKEGDIVHKSTDDYMDYMRKATLAGVNIESERVFKYQNDTQGDKYSKDILDELKRNTAAVKKSKPIINHSKTPDMNFQFWRWNQIKWR